METYDVRCPICSTVNRHLYFNEVRRDPLAGGYLTSQEETDGWMECESCHQLVKILDAPGIKTMDIPVYTPHQLMQRCHAAT